jgi:hypothetical protein
MALTSFDVDEHTAKVIARLQKTFGVKTKAAVIRKALAFSNVAAQHADAGGTITIRGVKNKPGVKVSLTG